MSENTRDNIHPKEKVVELEAPAILSKEQNLYDQQPFSAIVENAVKNSGKPVEEIRKAMSILAIKQAQLNIDNVGPQVNLDFSRLYRIAQSKGILTSILVSLFEEIKDYPDWSEYISSSSRNKRYRQDGKPQTSFWPKGGNNTLSYANWATQRLARKKGLMSVGIEEVFPKDMARVVDEIAPGKSPTNRKWRISKATGLKVR